VNKEMYIETLHGLRDTVRTKRPEKWTMLQHTGWFWSRIKEQRDNMEHTSCSPDLTPVDCYLLPRLKSALKRGLFYATGIIKYATEDLKRLS